MQSIIQKTSADSKYKKTIFALLAGVVILAVSAGLFYVIKILPETDVPTTPVSEPAAAGDSCILEFSAVDNRPIPTNTYGVTNKGSNQVIIPAELVIDGNAFTISINSGLRVPTATKKINAYVKIGNANVQNGTPQFSYARTFTEDQLNTAKQAFDLAGSMPDGAEAQSLLNKEGTKAWLVLQYLNENSQVFASCTDMPNWPNRPNYAYCSGDDGQFDRASVKIVTAPVEDPSPQCASIEMLVNGEPITTQQQQHLIPDTEVRLKCLGNNVEEGDIVQFRVRQEEVTIEEWELTVGQNTTNLSVSYTPTTLGNYDAQCRICRGSCTAEWYW